MQGHNSGTQHLAEEIVQLLDEMTPEDFRQLKKFQDAYNALPSTADLNQKDNYFAAQARAGVKGLIVLQKAGELYGQVKIELQDAGVAQKDINVDAVRERIKEKLVSTPISSEVVAKAKLLNQMSYFPVPSQELMFGSTAFNHIESGVLPSLWEENNAEIAALNEQLKSIDSEYLQARKKWNEVLSMELQGQTPDIPSAQAKNNFDVLDNLMKEVRARRELVSEQLLQPVEKVLAGNLNKSEENKKIIDDFQTKLFEDHIQRMQKLSVPSWKAREGSSRLIYAQVKLDALNRLKDTINNNYEDILSGKKTLLEVINNWKDEKVRVDLGTEKRSLSNNDILALQRRHTSRLFAKLDLKQSKTQIFIDDFCKTLEQSPTQRRKMS